MTIEEKVKILTSIFNKINIEDEENKKVLIEYIQSTVNIKNIIKNNKNT